MDGARQGPVAARTGALLRLVPLVGVLVFGVGAVVREPGGASFFLDVVVYEGVYLAGAVLCWRSRSRDRADRLAWRSVAVFLALNVIGDLWYTLVLTPLDAVPFPSLADASYLVAYLPLGASVVIMMRARVHRLRASMWLDGLVAALGAAGLALALAWRALLASGADNTAAVLVNLAYPLLDVALVVGVLASLAIVGLRRDGTLLALAAGLTISAGADLVYLVRVARDSYVAGGLTDVLWLLAVAALALGAGLRGGAGAAGAPTTPLLVETRISWRVLALPALAHGASVALLVVGWGDRLPIAAGVCAGACVVVAMVRTVVTFHEIRDLPVVRQQARTDELTGLANRRALLEHGGALLEPPGGRQAAPAALLLLDLNSFKEVNDSLGHQAGDVLLQQVAARLAGAVSAEHTLARLGGDEFAVLVPAGTAQQGLELAEAVTAALARPFLVEGVTLHAGASIGVASAPDPASTLAELVRCADVAMYEAKRARVAFAAFSGAQGRASSDRLRTSEELHEAFARAELLVHLQPQVRLRPPCPGGSGGTSSVVGVEALVRWQHPSRGLLAPAAFLEHVEHAGLQRALATTVLDLSLAAASRWWGRGHAVPVSVNLSAADVVDADLPSAVMAALERHALPATALSVELTEDALMHHPQRASVVLQVLRDAGVGVAIDDYGTGYASLAYLRTLPADELKLDRAFTADILTDPRARAIVTHTAALAHDLGMHLVAEGIETGEVLEELSALGCDRGQGHHIARPMPVEDLLTWLETGSPRCAGPLAAADPPPAGLSPATPVL